MNLIIGPNIYLDVTGVNLTRLLQFAFKISWPKELAALGFSDPDPGLSDKETHRFIRLDRLQECDVKWCEVLHADYIHSRQMKLWVFKLGDKLYMDNSWYDHTAKQYRGLLVCVGFGHLVDSVVESPSSEH